MRAELRAHLEGKRVLVLGVGNRLCGDDAVGSLLVERLSGRVGAPLIDASDVPENYLGPIEDARPELVLVVDAADLGADPGDAALFDLEAVRAAHLTTHAGHLGLVFQAMPAERRPQVLVLGIQPGNTQPGADLSAPVRATMERLETLLCELLPGPHPD